MKKDVIYFTIQSSVSEFEVQNFLFTNDLFGFFVSLDTLDTQQHYNMI